MRCLAALVFLLAATGASAKCVDMNEAAATIARENPKAVVSMLSAADVADLKPFFEADDSLSAKAQGFISVVLPDRLVIVPVFGTLVCDDLPVTMLIGEASDPIRHHLLRARARRGQPAPAGWVPERKA